MQRNFDKNWQIPLHDSGEVERMSRQLNIPVALAQLLCARKMTPEQGRRYLASSFSEVEPPTALYGCEKAAELILQGIDNNESFVIYGDYDVDGMSATVVLYRIITALGGKVNYYIPSRHDDGYGLHNHTVENLAQQGYNWLVTVDCGIRSVEEVELANRLGLKTIVTDHHQPLESGELPPALAVVHPAIPLNGKCTPELSGSAVAFKLAWQLCCAKMKSSNVGERLRNILLELLGIATLGIVADVVPLTGDNRILTANGLKYLRNRAPIGILALLQGLSLHEQILSAENISYKIAPTLNAAGRVGDPNKAVELLLSIQQPKAQSLVSQLLEWNFKRKTLEQEISRQAEELVKEQFQSEDDNPFLVLAGQDWHEGVLGIVASRMVEKFHRPTIILSIPNADDSEKPCSGSARSVEDFNVDAALAHCSDILPRHGGQLCSALARHPHDPRRRGRKPRTEGAMPRAARRERAFRRRRALQTRPLHPDLRLYAAAAAEQLARLHPARGLRSLGLVAAERQARLPQVDDLRGRQPQPAVLILTLILPALSHFGFCIHDNINNL